MFKEDRGIRKEVRKDSMGKTVRRNSQENCRTNLYILVDIRGET
jgi:hypothetical protein